MPRGDRTGPTGAGPTTGRGMGFCTGNNAPGYAAGGGFGCGMGRGMEFGFRNRFFAGWGNQAPAQPMNKEDQVSVLKTQMSQILQQIDALEGQE